MCVSQTIVLSIVGYCVFKIPDLCLTEMKSLARIGLINFPGGNNKITSKPEGEIMAKYSISFETMKLFMHVCFHSYNIY